MSLSEMKDMLNSDIVKILDHPLLFKSKLNIGSEAFRYLSAAKNLSSFLEMASGGIAAAGATAIAWYAGLGTFGKLALGAGLFVTWPIEWIGLAGAGGLGAVFGGKKLLNRAKKNCVDEVPKFINTPLDLLSISVFEILAPISVKIAKSDSEFCEEEIEYILNYFLNEWGYNRHFVERSILEMSQNADNISFDKLGKILTKVCQRAKDLKHDYVKTEIIRLARDVIAADGQIKLTEQNALKQLENSLSKDSNKGQKIFKKALAKVPFYKS